MSTETDAPEQEKDDGLDPDYERCPICRRPNCLGAMDVCGHWVASICDGSLYWGELSEELSEAWETAALHIWDLGPSAASLKTSLGGPRERDVLNALISQNQFWWLADAHTVKSEGTNLAGGWSGTSIYHESPEWFPEIVWATRAVAAAASSALRSSAPTREPHGLLPVVEEAEEFEPVIVLHVPHSSRWIAPEWRAQFSLNEEDLSHELLLMTDHYVDELVWASVPRTRLIRFGNSRLVLDPERFRDDTKEPMAHKGMGKVYERAHDARLLRRSLSHEEREQLLGLYDDHHRALAHAVEASLRAHGRCLVLDVHSFPSKPLPCDLDQELGRPSICLGTDSFHTPEWLVDEAQRVCAAFGWSVGIDRPYRGTLVPSAYFGSDNRVLGLMIELNRALYMNEATGERAASFQTVEQHVGELVRVVEALARGAR